MYRMIGADGREYGPISADQLRQWITQGRANASTNVLAEGATEWKPLGSLPEFSMQFTAPGPAPAPIAPAAFPTSFSPAPPTNGFATASLILGILSIPFGCCCCYGLPFSIPGLIFAFIALSQINASPERYYGKGMAIAAIVLCCVDLLLAGGLFLLGVTGSIWNSGTHHHGYRL
jgi:hypothetical protein